MADQLPSGRWRARIRTLDGKRASAHTIIGGPSTFNTQREAERAEDNARDQLLGKAELGVTLAEFWDTWTTSSLWARPAESTNIHNRERTKAFVGRYGTRPIASIDSKIASEWLTGGRNIGTVPALRAMFNDARSPAAGELTDRNPFENLRLPQSRGRRDKSPPSHGESARMLAVADRDTPPSFAAWLWVASYSGMRPGELDGLQWRDIDMQQRTIDVQRQWNAKVRKLTLPKHGHTRLIALTDPARDRLLELPRESEWVFTSLRGTHWTPSSRDHHWNRVRCSIGRPDLECYLATRHAFATYAWNVRRLDPEDIGAQLGHRDNGELVRSTYGHFDKAAARQRIRDAFTGLPPAIAALVAAES